ncbi:MAG TPA: hypothetical protein VI688_03180 [Anaerolineales bacterium]|nr:hypothetical protein [Anaerolineales bacterium]
MNQTFKLFRLQQIDSQLDKLSERLAEIGHLLSDDQVVREAKEAVAAAQSAVEAARRELQYSEEEAKAQQEKLKENQDSLYGGKVRNPKELQDLQLEADSLSRHLHDTEDKELGLMEGLEAQQASLQQAQENLEAALAQRAVEVRTLGSEQTELKAEEARLNAERETALSGIADDALELYDGLRKSKKGLAIAKVSNKTCTACGAELSSSLAEAARSPNALARCDSCKRILYSG